MSDVTRRRLHFNSLRAFEAAARLSSISAAAEELCVTRTAVTHQIKNLEEILGLELLVRTNRGVHMTEAGEMLLPVLVESFDRIATALDSLTLGDRDAAIHVTTTPSFAAKWLVPRLSKLRAANDAIEVHLLPTLRMLPLAKGRADVGIRCGLPPWVGLKSDLMLPIHMTPVCSPSLLEGARRLDDPRDVFDFPLIHADVDGHERGEEWRTWLAAAGVTELQNVHGLSFHDPGLALQAAIDGMGIAIGYMELAGPDLHAGRLIQPFDLTVRHAFSYYIVYSESRQDDPLIRSFRHWLASEAELALAGAD